MLPVSIPGRDFTTLLRLTPEDFSDPELRQEKCYIELITFMI